MYKVLDHFFCTLAQTSDAERHFLPNTPVLAHTFGYNPAPTLLPRSVVRMVRYVHDRHWHWGKMQKNKFQAVTLVCGYMIVLPGLTFVEF